MHPHRVTSYSGQSRKDHSALQNTPRRGSAASIPTNITGPLFPPPPPPRKESKMKKHSMIILSSLVHILGKQHALCSLLDIAKYFHLWRRETLLLVESMKSRSERTAALMLGGVDEVSLGHMEVTRSKSAKIGISIMKWMINSKHTTTLRRAWTMWNQMVTDARRLDSEVVTLHEANVELKNKLVEMKKVFQAKEILIRDGIVKNQLSNLLRAKMRASVRRRFDRWYRKTWEMKYHVEMRRERLKVDVGFQHIKSEREMVKETEIMSVKLKGTLLCSLAFYQWKVKSKDDLIRVERTRWAEEKRAVQKELLLLRQGLLAINKKEELLVKAARSRGMDVFTSLQSVGDIMSNVSKMSAETQEVTKKSSHSTRLRP